MSSAQPPSAVEAFEQALAGAPPRYVLRLYVTGMTPKSRRAIVNIQTICALHLQGCCDLQVIDLYQQPALAERDQIVAVPTLIKQLPGPPRRIIGDLSDHEQVLIWLDLKLRG